MTKPSSRRALGLCAAATVCIFLAPPADAGSKERSRLRAAMENTGLEPDASGKVSAKMRPDRALLKVKLRELRARSDYELRVNDELLADFETDKNGRGKVKLKARKGRGNFDIDPRDGVLHVCDDDGESVLEIDLEDDDSDGHREERTRLEPTDAATSGEAKVRYRERDGRRRFDVELEDVPVGDYTLLVDGIERGTIVVTENDEDSDSESGTEGEIEFDSQGDSDSDSDSDSDFEGDSDTDDGSDTDENLDSNVAFASNEDSDSDELPLDFDVLGALIEVLFGDDLWFSGEAMAQVEDGLADDDSDSDSDSDDDSDDDDQGEDDDDQGDDLDDD